MGRPKQISETEKEEVYTASRPFLCPLCGEYIWKGQKIVKVRIPGTMFGPYTAHKKCYEEYKKKHDAHGQT